MRVSLSDLVAVHGLLSELAEVADDDSEATPEQISAAALFLGREIERRTHLARRTA